MTTELHKQTYPCHFCPTEEGARFLHTETGHPIWHCLQWGFWWCGPEDSLPSAPSPGAVHCDWQRREYPPTLRGETVKNEHTEGPWSVVNAFPHSSKASNKRWLVNPDVAVTKTLANAEFIVRACNAHDDLLEVCRLIAGKDYDDPVGRTAAQAAESAIAKAT